MNNRKTTILYPAIILIGLVLICLLISATKSEFEPTSSITPDELDFLQTNLGLLNQNARLAEEKKDYREAKKIYLEILHYKPNDISTLYNLASCYAKLRKPELAAKALNFAIERGLTNISGLLADSIWIPLKNHRSFQPAYEKVKTLEIERGESFYSECKVLIRGYLRPPNSYNFTKSYPLLIMLHGNGGNAESLMPFRDKMGATDFFVAAPQGAYSRNILEINNPAYSWFFRTNDKNLWKKADPPVIEYILNVVRDIKTRYKISGVYILGHSQGGALAYMTGIKNPNIVNGVICYGAGNPEEFISASELNSAASKLPIFISNGWSDPQANFETAQKTKNMFIRRGYKVTFKPFDGGHWLDTKTLIEAKSWIDAIEQQRIVKEEKAQSE